MSNSRQGNDSIFLSSETIHDGNDTYKIEFYADAVHNPEKEAEFGKALVAVLIDIARKDLRGEINETV